MDQVFATTLNSFLHPPVGKIEAYATGFKFSEVDTDRVFLHNKCFICLLFDFFGECSIRPKRETWKKIF